MYIHKKYIIRYINLVKFLIIAGMKLEVEALTQAN